MTKAEFFGLMREQGVGFDSETWDSVSIMMIIGAVQANFDMMIATKVSNADNLDDIVRIIGEDKFDG